jgi:hypothetical protein
MMLGLVGDMHASIDRVDCYGFDVRSKITPSVQLESVGKNTFLDSGCVQNPDECKPL